VLSDECKKLLGQSIASQYIFTVKQNITEDPFSISDNYKKEGADITKVYNLTAFKGFSAYIDDVVLLQKIKSDPRLVLFENKYGLSGQNSVSSTNATMINTTDVNGNQTIPDQKEKDCDIDYDKILELSQNFTARQENFTALKTNVTALKTNVTGEVQI
jgi:hypothetical protein